MPDVIVIGAGLAGLRAADVLVNAGAEVLLLEARDRVGGRVRSHTFANGQWCEQGAEFIDTSHMAVRELAARLGLATIEVTHPDDDQRLVDIGGRATPFALNHSLAGELAIWRRALSTLAARIDADDPPGATDATLLDQVALDELVRSLGLGLAARVVIGREIRTEFMVSPAVVSQLMAAWMEALYERAGDGRESLRIAGGNDQLATRLAATLDGHLRLNSPVSTIDPDAGIVHLLTGEEFRADHVVAAVPVPVLGRMWRDMPAELAAIGYGIGGKVSVQFERRVWRDQGCAGAVVSDRAWGELWETSDRQPGDSGVLTALLSSNDGAALAALPDTAGRVIDEIERLFPGSKALAGERVQTDWTNDPYSLGCYVAFGPGQLSAAWAALRRPYARLHLAGEHTDVFSGYMEGAVRSGTRVAEAILTDRSMGQQPTTP